MNPSASPTKYTITTILIPFLTSLPTLVECQTKQNVFGKVLKQNDLNYNLQDELERKLAGTEYKPTEAELQILQDEWQQKNARGEEIHDFENHNECPLGIFLKLFFQVSRQFPHTYFRSSKSFEKS